MKKKFTKNVLFFTGIEPTPSWKKKGFSRRSPLTESNPRHPLRHRSTNELRYVTLVTTQLALRLRLVRTSRRNFFSPGKRHISASSEGRIGPNSRVGAPPNSSRLRGPPRNRKSSGDIFLRCCYIYASAYCEGRLSHPRNGHARAACSDHHRTCVDRRLRATDVAESFSFITEMFCCFFNRKTVSGPPSCARSPCCQWSPEHGRLDNVFGQHPSLHKERSAINRSLGILKALYTVIMSTNIIMLDCQVLLDSTVTGYVTWSTQFTRSLHVWL